MNYETFLETVKSALQTRLGDEHSIIINRVSKNNGIVLDGLCIQNPGNAIAPTIYLNHYYDALNQGISLETILDDIIMLATETPLPDSMSQLPMTSPAQFIDKIVYRLINAPANRELLRDVPHLHYPELELALVFCVLLEDSDMGQFTSLIHRDQAERYHLSAKLLTECAIHNTPRLLPPAIVPLQDIVRELLLESMDDSLKEEYPDTLTEMPADSHPFYVLSNTSGVNGACCIFYKSVLKNFAEQMDSDLYILPSSVHEVLILPDSDEVSCKDLHEMVLSINREELPPSDLLSNHIYRYTRDSDTITIAYHSPEPLGA